MKRMRTLIIICSGLIMLAGIYVAHIVSRKITYNNDFYFNNTNIHGELENVYTKYHGIGFKIKGVKKEFVFYPYIGKNNSYQDFGKIAKKGDLVIKPPKYDTLKLVKYGKIYLYTFEK